MTLHMLSVMVGVDGVGLELLCPGDNGQQLAHELACRPAGAEACLARVALAVRRLAGCWSGPSTRVEGHTPVQVWRDTTDGLLWFSAVTVEAQTAEEAARRLAAVSGFARYTEPEAWRMLLVSRVDVDLAHRKAGEAKIESQFLLDRWRRQLLAHLAGDAEKSEPGVAPS